MRASLAREVRNLKQDLFWHHTEGKLLREKHRIEAAISRNLQATHEMDEGWQERDSPSEEEIREVEFSHRENLYVTLRTIDEALARLADNSFGLCLDCGKKIQAKRLRMNPTVSRCLACQSACEGDRRRRPTL